MAGVVAKKVATQVDEKSVAGAPTLNLSANTPAATVVDLTNPTSLDPLEDEQEVARRDGRADQHGRVEVLRLRRPADRRGGARTARREHLHGRFAREQVERTAEVRVAVAEVAASDDLLPEIK